MASVTCVYAVDIPVVKVKKLYPHEHNCTELIFVRSGSGMIKNNDEYQKYESGQLIIYQPGSVHADIAAEPGWQFCIGLNGLAAEYLTPGVMNCSDKIKSIVDEMHDMLEWPAGKLKSLDMDIMAGCLAIKIRRELEKSVVKFAKKGENDICEYAKNEIDQHLDMPYTLDQLCEKIFISKSYLRKLFRKKYGESPLSYLIRKKLDVAEERLRFTDLPIRDIAAKVGINDPFYFTALFKRKKGISPSAYRKLYAGSAAKDTEENIPHA